MITLAQTFTAVAPNITSSFLASGGTSPYTYSVKPGGAGGSIDPASGLYTAPPAMGQTPQTLFDTIQVFDSVGGFAQSQILVGLPIFLLCDIIQSQLNLPPGRVYLWDQKILQPTDIGLYVAVSIQSCKPFGQSKQYDGNGNSIQSVNMYMATQIDIISRGPDARDRKEEIIMAVNSDYSALQQSANSFYIAPLPVGQQFVNLSQQDGAAIPYRFNITIAMQYQSTKTTAIPYFDTFTNPPTVITQP